MSDLNCPYCDAELEIDHDDGDSYEEDVLHEMKCHDCGKNFVFSTSISYYYDPQKADCLNGKDHLYKPTATIPKAATKMRCEWCSDERELTDYERNKLGIPTMKEYLAQMEEVGDD